MINPARIYNLRMCIVLFYLTLAFLNTFKDPLKCLIKINLIIDQLFFFPSIILVCRCYPSNSYGATESCSRLRRLQYASATVEKRKFHIFFLNKFYFSFSEYYDYELHVVEWGYVNKTISSRTFCVMRMRKKISLKNMQF